MEKVKLNVLGITSSQIQAGAYALVLTEEGGSYRIPVIVGVAEAQSIAVRLENVTPPRPLSHDLMVNMSHAFGIALDEVFIYKKITFHQSLSVIACLLTWPLQNE